MLSGISRKRSMRSNPYWFTEFCNSQCLSHFAAPFIVVRAETSVAESCKADGVAEEPPREDTSQHKCKVQINTTDGAGEDTTVGSRSHGAACEYLEGERLPRARSTPRDPRPSPRASPKLVHVEQFGCVRMILPQVHLRKPCYDFSFL